MRIPPVISFTISDDSGHAGTCGHQAHEDTHRKRNCDLHHDDPRQTHRAAQPRKWCCKQTNGHQNVETGVEEFTKNLPPAEPVLTIRSPRSGPSVSNRNGQHDLLDVVSEVSHERANNGANGPANGSNLESDDAPNESSDEAGECNLSRFHLATPLKVQISSENRWTYEL